MAAISAAEPAAAAKPLAGRVALITGASRGIGAAIARRLAAAGAYVAVNYSASEAAANEVVRAIAVGGAKAVAIRADVSSEADVKALVDQTIASFGRIDILVNNAGIFPTQPLADLDSATLDNVLDINVRGPIFVTRQAVPHMGQGGRIINLSSLAAKGAANMAAYAGSKAFIEGLTRSLALELGPRGITVNAVSPGATETEMFAPMLPMKEYVVSRTSLGRLGQADDIASVVAFLAGVEAGWVTGQVIGVDGGLSF